MSLIHCKLCNVPTAQAFLCPEYQVEAYAARMEQHRNADLLRKLEFPQRLSKAAEELERVTVDLKPI